MFEGLEPLSTFYLYAFGISALLTILYVLFGDALEAVFESLPISPTLIFSFITVFTGAGFILEFQTSLSSTVIAFISLLVAFILVTVLHIFILKPVSQAEQNTAYRMEDLIGQVGEVTVSIPVDGRGQVTFRSAFGVVAHVAKSIHNTEIKAKTNVQVVRVEGQTVWVDIPQD